MPKRMAQLMEERGIDVRGLARAAGLDRAVVKAIAAGNYTPSPSDRRRLADALGASPEDISWEHAVPVQHLRGNGPQSGRAT